MPWLNRTRKTQAEAPTRISSNALFAALFSAFFSRTKKCPHPKCRASWCVVLTLKTRFKNCDACPPSAHVTRIAVQVSAIRQIAEYEEKVETCDKKCKEVR